MLESGKLKLRPKPRPQMPAYDFHCSCGIRGTKVLAIASRNELVECECGLAMVRQQVYRANVTTDYAGYESPATGKWVEGKSAHREDLARSGCRIREPGETEQFLSRANERQESQGRAFESLIDKAAADLGLAA